MYAMIVDAHQLNNITLLLCIQKELHQYCYLLPHSHHPLQDSKLPLRKDGTSVFSSVLSCTLTQTLECLMCTHKSSETISDSADYIVQYWHMVITQLATLCHSLADCIDFLVSLDFSPCRISADRNFDYDIFLAVCMFHVHIFIKGTSCR